MVAPEELRSYRCQSSRTFRIRVGLVVQLLFRCKPVQRYRLVRVVVGYRGALGAFRWVGKGSVLVDHVSEDKVGIGPRYQGFDQ